MSSFLSSIRYLQQQKLLRHYSPARRMSRLPISTIVEITQALQPPRSVLPSTEIYNSRNYLGIIAYTRADSVQPQSTIVEITQALQPVQLQNKRIMNLQQQKLLRHYSHAHLHFGTAESTIVEITQALQPRKIKGLTDISTIVEITQALQPSCGIAMEHGGIYNSRNYLGIIAHY